MIQNIPAVYSKNYNHIPFYTSMEKCQLCNDSCSEAQWWSDNACRLIQNNRTSTAYYFMHQNHFPLSCLFSALAELINTKHFCTLWPIDFGLISLLLLYSLHY